MKKFKLFTTIASLCLACALLVFGVYAAGQATIGVSSNIKYDVAGQIAGVLTVTSYKSTDGVTLGDSMEVFTATVNATMTDQEAGDIDATEAEPKDSTFDKDNKYVIYVVDFEESTETNATVKITNPSLGENASDLISYTNNLETAKAADGLSETNGHEYALIVKLDKALNTTITFNVTFNVFVTVGA